MKTRKTDAVCGNCPMWSHTKDEWGQCREEAPLAELGEEYLRNYAIWPETKGDDWCAQHPDFWLEKHKEICHFKRLAQKIMDLPYDYAPSGHLVIARENVLALLQCDK